MRTSFADRLARHAADATASPAFVRADDVLSYAELHRRVEHAAAWLRDEGCGAGDVLGITIADELAHLVVSLAALALGLPQAGLPTFEPQAARLKLAQSLGVTRVIAVEPAHGLPGIAASFVTPGFLAQPRHVPLQEALNADPEAIAIFVASSGSTGEPKLIALNARMLDERHRHRGFTSRDRILGLTTIEDIFGKSTRLNVAWQGATSVHRSSPAQPLESLCATRGVTRLVVGVLQAASLVREDAAPLPAGLGVFASGARVSMRLREAYRATGRANLHVELGAREVGLVCTTWPHDRDPSLESVGTVVPTATVEVVDADGQPLPAGEIGEIRVRTTYMIDAYYRDPAATARNFRDGWFHPGDLGSFTRHGSLCLHGRVDDVMNLNGIKIYPTEIERFLESDPAVKAAAAFALRSDLHGEIPVAAIEWQGDARPDAAALLSRARAELGVRSPRRIVVVDALPRTVAGKIARRELARLAEEIR
jgi:acyl-coenzyme A synthetase/AMP-(fatty) acid ligase